MPKPDTFIRDPMPANGPHENMKLTPEERKQRKERIKAIYREQEGRRLAKNHELHGFCSSYQSKPHNKRTRKTGV